MANTRKLEDTMSWDWETAELRPGRGKGRTVVSVSFARDDFELVAKAARRRGKKTSEYIREAAIEAARRDARGMQRPMFVLSSLTASSPISAILATAVAGTTARSWSQRDEAFTR